MNGSERPRGEPSPTRIDHIAAACHRLLPTRILSKITRAVANSRRPWLKNPLNRFFVRRYGIDLTEAEDPRPESYPTFNALFTRALAADARPLADNPKAVIAPCDGTVSAVGRLDGEGILQAKGHHYSAAELLAGAAGPSHPFRNGAFITIYLSPRDYHRIHAPRDGRLLSAIHVPGRLLTVAPAAVRALPGLFLRNERLVTVWESDAGTVAVILVGAVNVGLMETAWGGPLSPRGRGDAAPLPSNGEVALRRGDELGRFNLGSTVILLFEDGRVAWRPELAPGSALRMGMEIGRSCH